jgi:hypothetical protein
MASYYMQYGRQLYFGMEDKGTTPVGADAHPATHHQRRALPDRAQEGWTWVYASTARTVAAAPRVSAGVASATCYSHSPQRGSAHGQSNDVNPLLLDHAPLYCSLLSHCTE